MEEMYSEIILDYYRNPKNFGTIEKPDSVAYDTNTLCGDEIQIQLKITDLFIEDIKFKGSGCAISQASISMLTEIVKGKSIDKVKKLNRQDILKILGVPISPVRLKCAMLGLKVFKLALYKYLEKI